LSGRQVPLGLWLAGAIVAGSAAALVLRLPGSLAPVTLLGTFVALIALPRRASAAAAAEADSADVLPAVDLSVKATHARPGGLLVPVRNPHRLDHLVRALESSTGRDVVVLSVRLQGMDAVDSDLDPQSHLTRDEQALF